MRKTNFLFFFIEIKALIWFPLCSTLSVPHSCPVLRLCCSQCQDVPLLLWESEDGDDGEGHDGEGGDGEGEDGDGEGGNGEGGDGEGGDQDEKDQICNRMNLSSLPARLAASISPVAWQSILVEFHWLAFPMQSLFKSSISLIRYSLTESVPGDVFTC